MLVNHISDLTHVKSQAVIINVGTKWVSTLATLSALRFLKMPLLLIDCESDDGSVEHFANLSSVHGFDLLRAPLKRHGITLDWLFRSLKADQIFLIDSDTELKSPAIVDIMMHSLKDERVFGAGFIHGPEWMTKVQTGFDHVRFGLYQERMWIPFCGLDRRKVVEALDSGLSFADRWEYNDLPQWPRVARALHGRFKHKAFEKSRLPILDAFRKTYYNAKPNYLCYDTGADIFQYLRYSRNYLYSGLPAHLHERYVSHFHGVTRRKLDKDEVNSTELEQIWQHINGRLRNEYGVIAPVR